MSSNKAVTYLAIDVPYCSLEYGVGDCPAVLGVDSTDKCFNTLKTCPVSESFDAENVTLLFATDVPYLNPEIEAIPCLEEVRVTPAKISLGESFGTRATVEVTLKDRPHGDIGPGFDKYRRERSWIAWLQGTLFGRFRSRYPYLAGKNMRVYFGFNDQTLEEMDVRHFVIESFDGPASDNRYRIFGQDPMKRASGDRAQAPKLSLGYLGSNLTTTSGSVTLLPSGIGSTYAASGYINLSGSEIAAYTRSGDRLTFTQRGALGTPRLNHNAEAKAQQVLRYESADLATIMYDLLVNYADFEPSYIDRDAWEEETGAALQQVFTGTVPEPTNVEDLIGEFMKQSPAASWWDESAQKARLQVLRGIVPAGEFTDDVLFDVRPADQPSKRVTEVWTHFGQRDPFGSLEDSTNYAAVEKTEAEDSASAYGVSIIEKIYSRWITGNGRALATQLNNLVLARYSDAPRSVKFKLPRRDDIDVRLGEVYTLYSAMFQQASGAPVGVNVQVTSIDARDSHYECEGEELFNALLNPDLLDERIIIVPPEKRNLDIRSAHDALYPTAEAGDKIRVIVPAGVDVGSNSTSIASVKTGTFATGVELTMTLRGRLLGRGGTGGYATSGRAGGNNNHSNPGGNGSDGGPALDADHPILIEGTGAIWGGGGGGAGGAGGGGGGDGGNGGKGETIKVDRNGDKPFEPADIRELDGGAGGLGGDGGQGGGGGGGGGGAGFPSGSGRTGAGGYRSGSAGGNGSRTSGGSGGSYGVGKARQNGGSGKKGVTISGGGGNYSGDGGDGGYGGAGGRGGSGGRGGGPGQNGSDATGAVSGQDGRDAQNGKGATINNTEKLSSRKVGGTPTSGTSGRNGGNAGSTARGGSAGAAIIGKSNVTFDPSASIDIRGPRV